MTDETAPGGRQAPVPRIHRVHLLDGGLEGWRRAGGELFRDVNVPARPSASWSRHDATRLAARRRGKALIDAQRRLVVLDARRFDEYQTMSIPTGDQRARRRTGAAGRASWRRDPDTRVIVNCAGRTRSIIGTQSLVNAGIPNPVAALRNGTIGWKLAGQALDHGPARRHRRRARRSRARRRARRTWRRRAGVRWIALETCATLRCSRQRTRLPLRRPHAARNTRPVICRVSPAPRRPAGAGDGSPRAGARRAHRVRRQRRGASADDGVVAGTDGMGGLRRGGAARSGAQRAWVRRRPDHPAAPSVSGDHGRQSANWPTPCAAPRKTLR